MSRLRRRRTTVHDGPYRGTGTVVMGPSSVSVDPGPGPSWDPRRTLVLRPHDQESARKDECRKRSNKQPDSDREVDVIDVPNSSPGEAPVKRRRARVIPPNTLFLAYVAVSGARGLAILTQEQQATERQECRYDEQPDHDDELVHLGRARAPGDRAEPDSRHDLLHNRQFPAPAHGTHRPRR